MLDADLESVIEVDGQGQQLKVRAKIFEDKFVFLVEVFDGLVVECWTEENQSEIALD